MENVKPNIILVNFDDLGYGDLACYGSEVNDTPYIDALCESGVQFTDFYACSPVCSPSRGGMMTGCYPKRIGFEDFEGERVLKPGQGVGLHPEEQTFASLLKGVGYKTMLCGKWHCGDQVEFFPTRFGFDEWYGIPYSNDMGRQVRTWSSPEELDKKYPPLPLMLNEEVLQEQPEQESLIERYVEASCRFISKNKKDKFLLYFAPLQVHLPLYAPKIFLERSRNGDFGACVTCVDWAVGALVEHLKKLGIYEDTMIIVTSDNGSRADNGASNYPLRGHKMETFEGGMRVPCIVHWDGKITPGVSRDIMSNIDFLKTFYKLSGCTEELKNKTDSIDFSEVLLNKNRGLRDTMLYYFEGTLEAIRLRNFKLFFMRNKQKVYELYDLETDVKEKINIYQMYPEVVEEILKIYREAIEDLGDTTIKTEGINTREHGVVRAPKMLTKYNKEHPYIVAIYDKEEDG